MSSSGGHAVYVACSAASKGVCIGTPLVALLDCTRVGGTRVLWIRMHSEILDALVLEAYDHLCELIDA